jgi:hypothetical protein
VAVYKCHYVKRGVLPDCLIPGSPACSWPLPTISPVPRCPRRAEKTLRGLQVSWAGLLRSCRRAAVLKSSIGSSLAGPARDDLETSMVPCQSLTRVPAGAATVLLLRMVENPSAGRPPYWPTLERRLVPSDLGLGPVTTTNVRPPKPNIQSQIRVAHDPLAPSREPLSPVALEPSSDLPMEASNHSSPCRTSAEVDAGGRSIISVRTHGSSAVNPSCG